MKKLACIQSKAVILILAINIIASAVCGLLSELSIIVPNSIKVHRNEQHETFKFRFEIATIAGFYSVVALILLFYPLGGLLADVYCGRSRCIAISLLIFWFGFAFQCIVITIWAFYGKHTYSSIPFGTLMFLCFLVGFSGFQSNVVQFGLDQLQEAPTEKLSIFLYWFVWTDALGQLITKVMLLIGNCFYQQPHKHRDILGLSLAPQLGIIVFSVLISLGYYKQGWFHMEPGGTNPYRMVFSVLNFARKHNYPLQRSAFTYTDDEKPSRIDFAKTKYGGPFTTEQVEDVKTFLRILALLMCIGPIFTAEVGAFYLYPLFGSHIGPNVTLTETACTVSWLLLQGGTLPAFVSTIIIPFYITVLFPLVKRKLPKILSRLHFGIVISVVGFASMLLIDTVGHSTSHTSKCLFTDLEHSFLNLPPACLIIPSVLLGVGSAVTYVSTLEFIAAQSPHAMKGLLFGVFYAVKGLFLLLGTGTLLIFVLGYPDSAAMSCCTGYYLLTTVIVSTGLVVFGVAVRHYKYRQREEPPYSYIPVENYFEQCREHRDIEGSQEDTTMQTLGNAESVPNI